MSRIIRKPTAIALAAASLLAVPAQAQLLGGALGGSLQGTLGSTVNGTIGRPLAADPMTVPRAVVRGEGSMRAEGSAKASKRVDPQAGSAYVDAGLVGTLAGTTSAVGMAPVLGSSEAAGSLDKRGEAGASAEAELIGTGAVRERLLESVGTGRRLAGETGARARTAVAGATDAATGVAGRIATRDSGAPAAALDGAGHLTPGAPSVSAEGCASGKARAEADASSRARKETSREAASREPAPDPAH